MKLVEGLPSSNCGWKDGYFFVCGDNWERLPEEGDDYVRIRRTWGTPSSVGVCVCFLCILVLFMLMYLFLKNSTCFA